MRVPTYARVDDDDDQIPRSHAATVRSGNVIPFASVRFADDSEEIGTGSPSNASIRPRRLPLPDRAPDQRDRVVSLQLDLCYRAATNTSNHPAFSG
jgi:hypothetical protein